MNLEKRQNEELIQRTWGIVLGMPPFVVLVLLHQWTLVGVFMFISFLAFQEYWKMVSEERVSFPIWFSLYPLILVYLFPLLHNFLIWAIGWYLFFLVLMTWSLLSPSRILERSGTYLWGCMYCLFLPSFWVKTGVEHSRFILFFFVLLVWINDIFAYLIGTKWGYHKITPTLSPKKSWEGFGGGLAMTILLGIILGYLWFRLPLWIGSIVGGSIATLSFMGDLFESALKRKVGLKDSGRFLPGHGGVLDRFDSLFTVGPLVYLWSTIIWKG